MATAAITELIDKLDNFEIVRDQIAAILKVEGDNQVALAAATSGKDPKLWRFRVFSERSNAWEFFQDGPDNADRGSDDDRGIPIVNVALNDIAAALAMGNVVERQQVDATFNVDCYGYGVAESDGNDGHIVADERASLEAQRLARLVRNILMSAQYVYLGLKGVVGRRWVTSLTMFQPQGVSSATQHVVGARLAFTVSLNEYSPQVKGELLELISASVTRATTGEVLFAADYPIPGV